MKRFTLLFMVLAAGLFAQEAMEAETPAEEMAPADSSMGMEAMMAPDTMAAPEEPMTMEEDAGESIESMMAEEGTMEVEASGSALIGYTVGLMGGFPVYMSSGMADGKAAPVYGVIAATPFGFAVGPFGIGVGAEIGYFDFSDAQEYKGLVALATLNTAIVETGAGAISVEVGGGYYGASVGGTGGVTFSYAVPGIPLVLKPYVRANMTLDSGNDIGSVAWVNAGLYLSFDISSMF